MRCDRGISSEKRFVIVFLVFIILTFLESGILMDVLSLNGLSWETQFMVCTEAGKTGLLCSGIFYSGKYTYHVFDPYYAMYKKEERLAGILFGLYLRIVWYRYRNLCDF